MDNCYGSLDGQGRDCKTLGYLTKRLAPTLKGLCAPTTPGPSVAGSDTMRGDGMVVDQGPWAAAETLTRQPP
jgi:hypothetical protein